MEAVLRLAAGRGATLMTDADNLSAAERAAPRPASTSSSLLARVRAGEPEGWRRLAALYTPLVLWWSRRHGLREPDAEDVAQEVFRTVAARFPRFMKDSRGGSFRGWLRAITHNKLGDFFRQAGKQPRAAGGSDMQDLLAEVPADPDSAAGPGDEASERHLLVRRALELIRDEFEARTWQAAWLVTVEEQGAADVAARLGMSAGAVYTAKSRVLSRLRQELADFLP